MKIERLKNDLDKARQKAASWQARAKDIERQITEQENMEIIQAVREVSVSPEELKELLGRLKSMESLPIPDISKEEKKEHES